MKADTFYEVLKEKGYGPFVGVPCSVLTPLLEAVSDGDKIVASSEGEAVGIACGLYLSGKNPVVFMQNSGLCNALNPITSLNLIYKIPLLFLITLRGGPKVKDAPQHEIMGRRTEDFLRILDINYKVLPSNSSGIKEDLDDLHRKMKESLKPAAFVLERGVFEAGNLPDQYRRGTDGFLSRESAINEIAKTLGNNCLVVTTTGMISRQYYCSEKMTDKNFYMVGSMGCASAIGLGLASAAGNNQKVVVIDGDGAVLMKMGNLATIGNLRPKNLVHIVLDNQCHETTGGQPTAAASVSLDKIAAASGYANTCRVSRPHQLQKVIKKVLKMSGPSFVLVKIRKTISKKDKPARPQQSPSEIKESFMSRLKE